jgi:hypothetical protein
MNSRWFFAGLPVAVSAALTETLHPHGPLMASRVTIRRSFAAASR